MRTNCCFSVPWPISTVNDTLHDAFGGLLSEMMDAERDLLVRDGNPVPYKPSSIISKKLVLPCPLRAAKMLILLSSRPKSNVLPSP